MQAIDSKIYSHIYSCGKGCVFTPWDFLDLGSRLVVDLVATATNLTLTFVSHRILTRNFASHNAEILRHNI